MTINAMRGYVRSLLCAAALCLATSGEALAVSAGCSQLSSGIFNLTNFSSGSPFSIVAGPFDAADRIELTVSGTSGTVSLLDPVVSTVLTYTLPGGAGAQTYVVASAGNYTLAMNSVSNISTSAQCVAAPTPSPSPSPEEKSSYDRSVAKGFLLSRINGILLNSPAATSLLHRSNSIAAGSRGAGAVPSAMGLGAGAELGAGTGSSRRDRRWPRRRRRHRVASSGAMNFSTSLSQMRRDAARVQSDRDRMSLGAGDPATLPAAFDIGSPWDFWSEGRYSSFNDDSANLNRDGHVGLLIVGSDYRITPDMIVGALVQFDWAKEGSSVLASSVDGNGWMAGPYLSARVHENIYFDLRAAWGRSSNDLAVGTTTASFDTSRWLVKGTLAGNWLYDDWRITPSAELAYVTESQDAFTNSAGVIVAGQDVSLGRLQFGPEFGYRIRRTADTFIEPFVALKGVWNFDNPNVAHHRRPHRRPRRLLGPARRWSQRDDELWMERAGARLLGRRRLVRLLRLHPSGHPQRAAQLASVPLTTARGGPDAAVCDELRAY